MVADLQVTCLYNAQGNGLVLLLRFKQVEVDERKEQFLRAAIVTSTIYFIIN